MQVKLIAKVFLDVIGVNKAVAKASTPRIAQAALLVERAAKVLMPRGGGSPPVARSKPGDPPFVQTGNLRSSITTAKIREGVYVVGPTLTAPYGRWLEFGTRKMAPRPFMRPAVRQVAPQFPDLFRNLNLRGNYRPRRRLR